MSEEEIKELMNFSTKRELAKQIIELEDTIQMYWVEKRKVEKLIDDFAKTPYAELDKKRWNDLIKELKQKLGIK
ncbi:MAG: hypothetical protein ACTSYG_10900 [Candidatus Heimdallarchaeota archaeon]